MYIMKRHLHCLLLCAVVLFLASCGGSVKIKALKYSFTAPDGYRVTAYELLKSKDKTYSRHPRAVVLYIQGSVYESAISKVDKLASTVIFGARAILVEKRGCHADSIDLKTAHRYSDKHTWKQDYMLVMDSVLKDVPADVPVILIGASEGGDLAPPIAKANPRVTHLILIGSGGGMSQKQEFRYFVQQQPGYMGIRDRRQLDSVFHDIETSEDDLKMWAGYPYRRWRTYMNDSVLVYLKDLDIPVLMLHGSADKSVPVVSARSLDSALRSEGRSNFTYREYLLADHSFIRTSDNKSLFPYLETDMIRWLQTHGVVKDIEARVFINRVKAHHNELEW